MTIEEYKAIWPPEAEVFEEFYTRKLYNARTEELARKRVLKKLRKANIINDMNDIINYTGGSKKSPSEVRKFNNNNGLDKLPFAFRGHAPALPDTPAYTDNFYFILKNPKIICKLFEEKCFYKNDL